MSKRRHFRRIGIAFLVLVLSVTFLSLFSYSNATSPEMAFRRKEKENLIGPAEIFATLDFPHGSQKMLIGKSEYGYTFFEWNGNRWNEGKLTYVPRREGATLYCTNDQYPSEERSFDWTPIFAFVDHGGATNAKLTLTVTYDGQTVTHPLESKRNAEGYFLFSWETLFLPGKEYWSIQQLIAGQHAGYVLDDCTVQATLELYSSNGTLLETYHFTK